MARFQRATPKNHKKRPYGSARPAQDEPAAYQPPPEVTYGDKFVVLEDSEKNTFVFDGGAWVAYRMSIAECRVRCQVKALNQKVNNKTRYEIREPLN